MEEALARLAGLEQEKIHWNFMNEVGICIYKMKTHNICVFGGFSDFDSQKKCPDNELMK